MGLHLDRVTDDAAAIAAVVRSAPDASIACYDGWTVVDLAGHVGQIHRWVTGIVAERAAERPTTPFETPPGPDALADWVVDGARALVAVLEAAAPDDAVWTISRTARDTAFWRQRMVLETALHRWDAEAAASLDPAVDDEVAHAGLLETLDVYLAQRLHGQDVGGAGHRVAFVPTHGDAATLVLHADGVELLPGDTDADARVHGSPLDLWLLLGCRRPLTGLDVEGDEEAAALAVRAATLSPGPA